MLLYSKQIYNIWNAISHPSLRKCFYQRVLSIRFPISNNLKGLFTLY